MPRKKKYKWLKGCERRRYKSRQELFDIAKGNTDFATDAFIKAYEKEEEYNIAMAEKKRQEEEENFRKLASVDYRRDIYFQVNNLSEIDKLKAYIVTFKEHPNLLYVAFSLNREKAEAEAQRYMRDIYYSMYSITDCPISLKEAHALRAKNLDKYKTTGKIKTEYDLDKNIGSLMETITNIFTLSFDEAIKKVEIIFILAKFF